MIVSSIEFFVSSICDSVSDCGGEVLSDKTILLVSVAELAGFEGKVIAVAKFL